MKKNSLKAIALVSLFTVSLAASAAVQFAPEKKEVKNERKIDKAAFKKIPTHG